MKPSTDWFEVCVSTWSRLCGPLQMPPLLTGDLKKHGGSSFGGFDDAGCARIEADQEQGLIPEFDARPVAIALNLLDAYTLIERVRAAPKERAGTGSGGFGSDLGFHTLWQRVARERVLESRPDMSQAVWRIRYE